MRSEYLFLKRFLDWSFEMGVKMNKRLPGALAGLFAVALMTVAGTTTLSAQTTMTPRLVVRALTNGDISSYKLPSTTQVSGGLGTVGLGEPLYLEVQVDIGLTAAQLGGVTWAISEAPSGSAAKLAASPLGAAVPIAEPSDRLVYQVAGRQLLQPDRSRALRSECHRDDQRHGDGAGAIVYCRHLCGRSRLHAVPWRRACPGAGNTVVEDGPRQRLHQRHQRHRHRGLHRKRVLCPLPYRGL